jgi:hypothetical protein
MDEVSHDFFFIDRLQSKQLTYIRNETTKCNAVAKIINLRRDREKLQFPNNVFFVFLPWHTTFRMTAT